MSKFPSDQDLDGPALLVSDVGPPPHPSIASSSSTRARALAEEDGEAGNESKPPSYEPMSAIAEFCQSFTGSGKAKSQPRCATVEVIC